MEGICSASYPEPLSNEEVFQMLHYSYQRRMLLNDLPLRQKASPITPSVPCFYVIGVNQNNDFGDSQIKPSAAKKSKVSSKKSSKVKCEVDEENDYLDLFDGCESLDDPRVFNVDGTQNVHTGVVSDMDQRIARFMDMQTEDSIEEQKLLKGARYFQSSRVPEGRIEDNHNNIVERIISVKYQGFHGKNSVFWWSAEHDFTLGLVIRSMAKVQRPTRAKRTNGRRESVAPKSSHESSERHGFAGKVFSLVKRSLTEAQKEMAAYGSTLKSILMRHKNSKIDVRKYLVYDIPSLVQFWKSTRSENNSEDLGFDATRVKRISDALKVFFADIVKEEKVLSMENREWILHGDQPHHVTTTSTNISQTKKSLSGHRSVPTSESACSGDSSLLSFGNETKRSPIVLQTLDRTGKSIELEIHGNLIVDGKIRGKLHTSRDLADYAEWFDFDVSNNGEDIRPGDLVQLLENKVITKNLEGESRRKAVGPIMVVSHTPSIKAGKARNKIEYKDGAYCAFMGQVPIRTRGHIRCGDLLYPSGKNDGCAVNLKAINPDELMVHIASSMKKNYPDISMLEVGPAPIAVAMEDSNASEKLVKCFVRWQHDEKHFRLKESRANFFSAAWFLWFCRIMQLCDNIMSGIYFFGYGQGEFAIEKFFLLIEVGLYMFTIYVFPNYQNFTRRGDCLIFAAYRCLKIAYQTFILSYVIQSTQQESFSSSTINASTQKHLFMSETCDPSVNAILIDNVSDMNAMLFVITLSNLVSTCISLLNIINVASKTLRTYPEHCHPLIKKVFKPLASLDS